MVQSLFSQHDGKAWVFVSSTGGVLCCMQCLTFIDCAVTDIVALRMRCTWFSGKRNSRDALLWALGGRGLYCSINVYQILHELSFP